LLLQRRFDSSIVPLRIDVGGFSMPDRLRERFKTASPREADPGDDTDAEEFGIDPETATYKYDTGR
jgi:hypothetical protein